MINSEAELCKVRRYFFYLGTGGNCIKFIASLAHYNFSESNAIMPFHSNGTAHRYANANRLNNTLNRGTEQFAITNIPLDEMNLNNVDVYTQIILDNELDYKLSRINHYLKHGFNTQFYDSFYKDTIIKPNISDEEVFNEFCKHEAFSIFKKIDIVTSTQVFNLSFSDIYRNKNKVIYFIENLTQKKSNTMLMTNYDNYIELQKKILIEKAPWFYFNEGQYYFT